MSNDDDRDVIAALAIEVSSLRRPMELSLRPETVFAMVGVLQLALRHPDLPASSRSTARAFITGARAYFEDCPAVLMVIDRGDDPSEDRGVSLDDDDGPVIAQFRIATDDEQRAAIVAVARAKVQAGEASHDCGEWRGADGRCELCDRELRPA